MGKNFLIMFLVENCDSSPVVSEEDNERRVFLLSKDLLQKNLGKVEAVFSPLPIFAESYDHLEASSGYGR